MASFLDDRPHTVHKRGLHIPTQWKEPTRPIKKLVDSKTLNSTVTKKPGNYQKSCKHCGEPISSAEQQFCCRGCKTVYTLLEEKNLSSYYDMMQQLGQSPAKPESAQDRYLSAPQETLSQLFFDEPNQRYSLYVPSMHCAACSWIIEKILMDIGDIGSIESDPFKKFIHVGSNRGFQFEQLLQILKKLENIGYPALPIQLARDNIHQILRKRSSLLRLGVAGFCFGNMMLFSVALYLGELGSGISPIYAQLFKTLSAGLTLPVLTFSALPIFQGFLQSLRLKTVGIDIPIALALIAGTFASIYNLLHGDSQLIYFDTVAGLVFVILAARYFNESVLHRANELSAGAESFLPARSEWVKHGETITVQKGERLPADGILLSESTEVDEACLTGEFAPVLKQCGARLYAGTENLAQELSMKVLAVRDETQLGKVEKALEKIQAAPSYLQSIAQRAVKYFVLILLAATVLNLLIRYGFGLGDLFATSVAILVIGCPCGLAFAIPLASALTLKSLLKNNIFVKTESILDRFSNISDLIIDKTGTLTDGNYRIVDHSQNRAPSEKEAALILYACRQSLHPVNKPIEASLSEHSERSLSNLEISFREIPGRGILVFIGKEEFLRIGRQTFCEELDQSKLPDNSALTSTCSPNRPTKSQNVTEVCIQTASGYFGSYFLQDNFREGSLDLLRFAARSGLSCTILSGDKKQVVEEISTKIRDHIPGLQLISLGEQLPDEKRSFIKKLKETGHYCIMLGDGVNDATALAASDIGVSVKGSVELAMKSADICLTDKNLGLVTQLFRASRRCVQTQKTISSVCLLYNILAIGLAACGYVHPVFAAILMPVSSLSVYLIAAKRSVLMPKRTKV